MTGSRYNLLTGPRNQVSPLLTRRVVRTADGVFTPILVDGAGNYISGTDLVHSVPIPNLVPGNVKHRVTGRWNGYFTYGQSKSTGTHAQPAKTLTQPYNNRTFGSGPKSCTAGNTFGGVTTSPGTSTSIPLVEDNLQMVTGGDPSDQGETWTSVACNEVVRRAIADGIDPADHKWFGSAPGKPGTAIEGLDSASSWWLVLADHVVKQYARTYGDTGTEYVVRLLALGEGEANAGNSPAVDPSGPNYKARMIGMIRDFTVLARQTTGQVVPPFMQIYQTAYNVTTDTGGGAGAIADAQYQGSLECAQIDFLFNDAFIPHYGDFLHWTNNGSIIAGLHFGLGAYQRCVLGRKPDYCKPLTASATDTVLTLEYLPPTSGMQILVTADGATGPTPQSGVRLLDTLGDIGLTNFRGNPTTIQCDMDRPLSGGTTVRVGRDFRAPGVGVNVGATYDIADGTAEALTYGDVSWTLRHVPPSYTMNVSH